MADGAGLNLDEFDTVEAYQAAVIDSLDPDDEEGIAAAQEMFAQFKGIDLSTGLPLEGEDLSAGAGADEDDKGLNARLADAFGTDPKEGEGAGTDADDKGVQETDEQKAAREAAEAEAAAEASRKAAAEAEAARQRGAELTETQKAAIQAEAARQSEEQNALILAENERLKEQIAASNRERDEALIDKRLHDRSDDIWKQATARVDARMPSSPVGKDLDAKIKSITEEFGEEAAEATIELRDKLLESHKKDRDRQISDEAKKIWDDLRGQEMEQIETTRTIESIPELDKWMADANAARAGDKTKSALNWDIAVGVELGMKQDPAWKDKPDPERYAEVVRRVREATAGSAASGAPDNEPERGTGVVDKIKQQLGQDQLPGSMSDLAGGAAPTDAVTRLEQMTHLELNDLLESGKISVDDLDEILAKRDDEDYF